MPCIMIRTRKPDCKFDIKGFGQELSRQMGIEVGRVNIIVDFFDESDVFFGSEADSLIITLYVSEANDECFNKLLVQTIAALAEKHFCKEKKHIAVMCNLIREGHMFLDNQFK
ncbi:MAG: hypothetical protein APF77_11285 [Clostridia bacterium BRH_c25]|nr:MAG: hypothetical protein APF77_11285 [Clostridia bacterium BRH_c25]